MSLGYMGVETPFAREWETFGPEVLGMPLADAGSDGSVRLRMDDRHHRLSFHPGSRNRLAYIGWELPDEEALADATHELTQKGLSVFSGAEAEVADRAVSGFTWFNDNLGVRHELFYGQRNLARTFQAPRPMSGFVTGENGMGHVALAVPELSTSTAFYTRYLHFGVSDEVDGLLRLTFLHCNGRHHSLALMEMAGVHGILHLMVQVKELDDVGIAYDLCQSRRVQLSRTLGRHTNDRTVSFYMRTPSGFDVEYGWGAIEIDESHAATVFTTGSLWGHHNARLPPGAIESVESG